jgi:hypothetical protein
MRDWLPRMAWAMLALAAWPACANARAQGKREYIAKQREKQPARP